MGFQPRLLLAVAAAAAAAVPAGLGAGTTGAPAAPYRVVWNSPWPLQCYTFCHVDPPSLNLSAYSIEANGVNANGSMSSESGAVLTLWDEYLGLYPSHRSLTLGPLHGGVPQLAVLNLSAHLAKLTSDINTGLHNPRNGIMVAKPLPADFSGIGVLDWEAWPFTWSRFGLSGFTPSNSVYMNTSVELVLADYPTWPPAKAEAEAGRRWDAAARTFIEATLSTLHTLRPRGKFGFFGWPDCDNHLTADGEPLGCSDSFRAMNDRDLGWLWNASSALFPSTYIAQPPGEYAYQRHGKNLTKNITYASNQRWVDDQIAEALHVAASVKDPRQRPAVYPYGRAVYYSRNSSVLQPEDLVATVARPSAHGVDGVILWGSSGDCEAAPNGMSCDAKCEQQAKYIATHLGPAAANAVNNAVTCAASHCQIGERCVSVDDTGVALPQPKCTVVRPKVNDAQQHPIQPNYEVTTVHIVSQCHLDAGYKGPFVAGVLSEWFNKWIPHSIALSQQLREAGGQEQHRWTMPPWVASYFLDCPTDGAVWTEENEYTRRRNTSDAVLSFRLQCPNASTVASFRAAVVRGDISLYASSFCTMYEYGDAGLARWTSDFARSVEVLAGQPHRSTVASQRDEPGITRAAIPLLVDRGVTGFVIGVDEASPVAAVPRAFRWRDRGSGKELLVAWHGYGYGGGNSGGGPANVSGPNQCQSQPPADGSGFNSGKYCNSTITVPGLSHALALFTQQDDEGPPSKAQILHYYSQLRLMFPNATLVASTYEAFFKELSKMREQLPLVDREIGDTWVDTPPSDPLLASQFRALMRVRRQCVETMPEVCNASNASSAFYHFSRYLLKNMEHDWGPGLFMLPSEENGVWSNAELQGNLSKCNGLPELGMPCEGVVGWLDQRAWSVGLALHALNKTTPPHPLLETATVELADLSPRYPGSAVATMIPVAHDEWQAPLAVYEIARVAFDQSGSIVQLRSTSNNLSWADNSHRLAQLVVHVSSAQQRRAWGAAYLVSQPASGSFFKTANPLGDGRGYVPAVTGMWRSMHNDSVLFRQHLPAHVVRDFGGAQELWQRYDFAEHHQGRQHHLRIAITVWAFNKTATRTTESWWLRFQPVENAILQHRNMRLSKLGTLIDPLDVVLNGSRSLHGVDERGVVYINQRERQHQRSRGDTVSFRVSSLDVPVVKIGAGNASLQPDAPPLDALNPSPLPIASLPRLSSGFAWNIYNNIWGTNAIQWYPFVTRDKHWKFRFSMDVPLSA